MGFSHPPKYPSEHPQVPLNLLELVGELPANLGLVPQRYYVCMCESWAGPVWWDQPGGT